MMSKPRTKAKKQGRWRRIGFCDTKSVSFEGPRQTASQTCVCSRFLPSVVLDFKEEHGNTNVPRDFVFKHSSVSAMPLERACDTGNFLASLTHGVLSVSGTGKMGSPDALSTQNK